MRDLLLGGFNCGECGLDRLIFVGKIDYRRERDERVNRIDVVSDFRCESR